MNWMIILTFVLGYIVIAFEHPLRINKSATALVTGVLCWTIYMLNKEDAQLVNHQLLEHLGDISSILFFLLGAMVIVELIDAHDGFELITERIKTKKINKLIIIISIITFFLSAFLDNLTTTIVMVSLCKKLMIQKENRLIFVGMIVLSANAGGAWSPIGDVTTTMLWIGNQITAINIMQKLFLPSLVCLIVPLIIILPKMKGEVIPPSISNAFNAQGNMVITNESEKKIVFTIGIGALIFVPVFKTFTHLPPFMGMLLGLGIMWILTEIIHFQKDEMDKDFLSVIYALRKADTPSILFFLGILMSIAALQSTGILTELAQTLSSKVTNDTVLVIIIGFLSAVVDNVPLVAAAQGMYSLEKYQTDHYFWEFLAYCTGTGGSSLIIGSAAGVAAMGIEKIDFIWYLKKISFLAVIGYLSGALVYIVLN